MIGHCACGTTHENLRRGHYELGVAAAFDELSAAI
jgi:hypothetical protein